MKDKKLKIAVGLSGGVDSSVAAAVLKEQGHDVIGVHMLRWDSDMPGCTGDLDRQDALKVAKKLDIPFKVVDFRDRYDERVVKPFLQEFQNGRTPNPDVWCNEEIKFGIFLEYALEELGVDKIATGHYARIWEYRNANIETRKGKGLHSASNRYSNKPRHSEAMPKNLHNTNLAFAFVQDDGGTQCSYHLLTGIDQSKDQSYFLYRLNQHQLSHALFPLGEFTKDQIREKATALDLPTASKPDSVGICFIGDIDVKEFLKERLDIRSGEVVTLEGDVIGHHEGVQLYTIGQRHGFEITEYQGLPMYVVKKDVVQNQLVVGRGHASEVSCFLVEDIFLNSKYPSHFGGNRRHAMATCHGSPQHQGAYSGDSSASPQNDKVELDDALTLTVRIRHLGEQYPCRLEENGDGVVCFLDKPIQGVSPGQHAVFYLNDVVLGGGVISQTGV